jgi:uncharacterized coiled-coil protein SlyX
VAADDWMNLEARISKLEAESSHYQAVLAGLDTINAHLVDIKRLLDRRPES